ncbi:hypothetical protein FBY04_10257 [Pseudomonas sp. SJZ080]|nr:hypothetical protein FBY04_10257 [Pseudomonas sp. SJZ080]
MNDTTPVGAGLLAIAYDAVDQEHRVNSIASKPAPAEACASLRFCRNEQ